VAHGNALFSRSDQFFFLAKAMLISSSCYIKRVILQALFFFSMILAPITIDG
jgi:hypothetical protein